MNDQIEFELRISSGSDIAKIEELVRNEIESESSLHVQKTERVIPFGMTEGDIAISFIVSLVSSAIVQVCREQIDAAVKRASEHLHIAIKTIFPD